MKISPINNYMFCKNTNINKSITKLPSFGSIFADSRPDNQFEYYNALLASPEMTELKGCSTRIFREVPSQLTMAKLLKPNQKSEVKILGCADGSEAWAYAIAFKEEMGEKAKDAVKIKGVDIKPYMVELAKTGKIVCSDIERRYADGSGERTRDDSPIKGSKRDKYLIQTTRPESMDDMISRYPLLQYMEYDPVVGKRIGSGLDWYDINKEGLPDVSFEQGDMMDHLDSDDESDNTVYVIANSSGYILQKNPDKYIDIFKKIKEANKGKEKNVYVVIGEVENTLLSPTMSKRLQMPQHVQNNVRNTINRLGFEKISEHKVRKLGISNNRDAASKIYKLNA